MAAAVDGELGMEVGPTDDRVHTEPVHTRKTEVLEHDRQVAGLPTTAIHVLGRPDAATDRSSQRG